MSAEPCDRIDSGIDQILSLWHVGDWDELARLFDTPIDSFDQRVEIALIFAVAAIQLGQSKRSMDFVAKAREWGASNLEVSKYLLSGAYSSLASAAMLAGDQFQDVADKSLSHAVSEFVDKKERSNVEKLRLLVQKDRLERHPPLSQREREELFGEAAFHSDCLLAVLQTPGWTFEQVLQWAMVWLRAIVAHASLRPKLNSDTLSRAGYKGEYDCWVSEVWLDASPENLLLQPEHFPKFIGVRKDLETYVPLAEVLYLGLLKVFTNILRVAKPSDRIWLDSRRLAREVLNCLGQGADSNDLADIEKRWLENSDTRAASNYAPAFPHFHVGKEFSDNVTSVMLYWRSEGESFSARRSTKKRFILDGSEHTFILPIEDRSGLLSSLRLDVANRPGCFKLISVELITSDADVIWSWSDAEQLAKHVQMAMTPDGESDGVYLLSCGDDPQIVLDLPKYVLMQLYRPSVLKVCLAGWT